MGLILSLIVPVGFGFVLERIGEKENEPWA